jgi:hypothetical protein
MLTQKRFDKMGRQLGDGEAGFAGIFDEIGNAIGTAFNAVKDVAGAACNAAGTLGPNGANLLAAYNKDAGYITGQAVNYCQQYDSIVNPAGATSTLPGMVAPTAPTARTAPTSIYPTGSVARFNTSKNLYAIYAPIGAKAGLGGVNIFGLGADVTPAPPAGMIQVGTSATLPAGVTNVGIEKDAFFSLSNPWMWASIVGGVAVVGTGSYLLFRRKQA